MPPVVTILEGSFGKKQRPLQHRGSRSCNNKNLREQTKKKVAKSLAEQLLINKAVHYTAWANLQKPEFAAVASAFKESLASMSIAAWSRVFVLQTKHRAYDQFLTSSEKTPRASAEPRGTSTGEPLV
jgi:hypothetical protein